MLATVWALISLVMAVGSWVYIPTMIVHDMSVKGTARRYKCRSIMRPTQWLCEGDMVRLLGHVIVHDHMHWWFTFALLGQIWCVFFYGVRIWFFYQSDEDDWWKNTKKRVKRWLRRAARTRIRVRIPVPVPTA